MWALNRVFPKRASVTAVAASSPMHRQLLPRSCCDVRSVVGKLSASEANHRSFLSLLFLNRKISAEIYSKEAHASSVPDGAIAFSRTAASAENNSTSPVIIALMYRFYFGERFARFVPSCTWKETGESLRCEFTADQVRVNDSSALE